MTDAGCSVEKVGVAKNVGEEFLGALAEEDGGEARWGGFCWCLDTLSLAGQELQAAEGRDAWALYADWGSGHRQRITLEVTWVVVFGDCGVESGRRWRRL